MNKKILTISILSLAVTAAVFFMPQETQAQESSSAKAGRLLSESGVSFSKVTNDVWIVPFKGKELGDFNVLIGAGKDVLVMFVTVTDKKKYTKAPELLAKLLTKTDDMDRVKIGLDKDGNVVVRIDLTMRLLDKREFSENLDQLGAASDEVFAVIKPYLTR